MLRVDTPCAGARGGRLAQSLNLRYPAHAARRGRKTERVSTTSHYQIVIVGTDLAGLVFGALCAKRGYRVLILGQGTSGALYEQQGHTLVRRLDLIYGLQSPPVRRVFEELSLGLELRNLPRAQEPAYQVLLPKARLDISSQDRVLQRELRREFPEQVQAIGEFYRTVADVDAKVEEVLRLRPTMPPSGLVERFAIRRLTARFPFLEDEWAMDDPLQRLPHGSPLRAMVHAPFRFVSGMLPAKPYPATFVRAVTELGKGTYTFDKGPDALRDLFLDLVKQGAGDVLTKASAVQIDMRRGKAVAVVLRDRRQVIGCDLLVCNTDPKRFFHLIPQEVQDEEYHHAIHMLQPVYYTFVGNFVVRARAIPEALARHAFAVHDLLLPLEEDNCVHIARDADIGGSAEERELRLITASMRVPLHAASGGPRTAEHLLDRLQRRVEETIPFLSEHLVFRDTPWLRAGQDGEMADVDPTELQPCYGEAIAQTLGTSPVATQTGYKNILLGGNASFCGLGHDGPYVAALNLLALAQDLVKLKSGF